MLIRAHCNWLQPQLRQGRRQLVVQCSTNRCTCVCTALYRIALIFLIQKHNLDRTLQSGFCIVRQWWILYKISVCSSPFFSNISNSSLILSEIHSIFEAIFSCVSSSMKLNFTDSLRDSHLAQIFSLCLLMPPYASLCLPMPPYASLCLPMPP